tara:strand:+ start:4064 stop:4282 length:219 start_codon:yes stop_codon:yes gene_type:complete
MSNKLRAEAALVALRAFNNHMPNGEDDEVVGDLLCNLMHLLDDPDLGFSHLSFSQEIEKAYRYHEEDDDDED